MDTILSDDICRTCMKKDGKFRSIFSDNKKLSSKISDMLQVCVSLQATEDDALPKQICSKCVYNLSAFYQFRQTCVSSDQTFRQRLLQKENDKCDIKIDNELIAYSPPKLDENTSFLEPEVDKLEPSLLCKIEVQQQHNVSVSDEKCNEQTVEMTAKKPKRTRKAPGESKKRQTRPHQCEICGKFLSCHSNLVQHMRRHTGERPFKCDSCGKAFSRAEHLTIHKRIHTGERPHSCEICGKSFVQYAALACHVRTHTGERPHACPACGKSFAQAVTLTYHMRSHTGETPYVCTVCGKGFTHSGNLNIHMRFHNGERPYVCNHCGQRFVTSSHLSVHVKHHTGEKNHCCAVCGKAFVRKEHLRSHMMSHTGQKPYCCKLCGKCYSQSSHLSRHMKTHKPTNILGI